MKLQFKYQAFQAEAAAAVCDVFNGQPRRTFSYRLDQRDLAGMQQALDMTDTGFCNHPLVPELTRPRILDNLKSVQRRNGLPPSSDLAGTGINLSIEMETGTGKTYTYIKTMYELNARYGWSKFIIVVPSVAIREGVYSSLQSTQKHFAEEYGKKIRFFIYSSDRLAEVDRFACDSAINVMIINMQAFNSSKNQRIIDKKSDTVRSRRPIQIIAKTNPILIIDEPQSVEGRQTKESLKKFHALFTLRYSATHKEKYNMVYRLDAMDAYNQHLVKKIAALGVTLTGTTATNSFVYLEGIDLYKDKAPTARLGFEVRGKTGIRTVVRKVRGGDDLYALSNGLDEYQDHYVIPPDGINGQENSVTFLNGLKLFAGQISGNEQMTALQRRVQIRETIRTHLNRERELYPKGIKVLSLFFIDEVAKYRLYDGNSDDGRNGEYAKLFEAEYQSVVEELRGEIDDASYLEYLDQIDVHRTHQGYFSVDKKKGRKARFVESKITDKKARTSDDANAYDLIMKDKERLLSLDEPVRFIFSHSALREGWDNPNVFQICTLKPQSESDIRSRQEIGRGLRLCVNQQGERMDESALGGEVQELNKLTLITDLEFGKFAEALQNGLAESLADRPQAVNMDLFIRQELVNASGNRIVVSKDLAEEIYFGLREQGYVKDHKLTDKFFADRDSGTVQVIEEVKDYAASVVQLLSQVFDPRALPAENAYDSNVTARVDLDKLKEKDFLDLWEKINAKSFYTVSFDTQELIKKAVKALDAHLNVSRIFVRRKYGEQTEQIQSRAQLLQGKAFQCSRASQTEAERPLLGGVRYDLIGKLVEETGLTRSTIAAILQRMAPQKFVMFQANPEDFIFQAAKLINNEKATSIVENITYRKLDAAYDTSIFTKAHLRGKLGVTAVPAERSIYDYVICDSEGERKFVTDLEIHQDTVKLYIKLPKSFFISTPVGRYSPDWAIAFQEGTVKRVYFVAETKGVSEIETLQLRGVEAAKIQCAKAHFAAISNEDVTYDVVSDFEQLLNLAS